MNDLFPLKVFLHFAKQQIEEGKEEANAEVAEVQKSTVVRRRGSSRTSDYRVSQHVQSSEEI